MTAEEAVYHCIFDIRDPERRTSTLEDLGIVDLNRISITQRASPGALTLVEISIRPTLRHCKSVLFIGLCIYHRLLTASSLPLGQTKYTVQCEPDSHLEWESGECSVPLIVHIEILS
eukprot:Protomagalhaensia_wolfi_Nauph_80__41@NODE_1024_length_1799_cov_11_481818_g773_i0_p2_GENE_NODE_1024_length_1799_cov_11_481818_g773_i0NODE_1024_length_1799_cov_11_481818_g773_i0_p2_ORF_typecomplete_len117_score1_80FeS_assembly_P/PF01883_19/1_7e06_NODE_1024_length_1799_cov_11_481818_g773_i088438